MDRAQEYDNAITMIEQVNLLAVFEGLLFAAGTEGLTDKQIANLFQLEESQVRHLCEQLADLQTREGRYIRVARLADTWQLITHPDLTPYLRALALTPTPNTLTGAALETLAIIAYKQPITRGQIEEIRGVKTDKPLGTLVARGLIREIGRAEGPGRPYLYGTTKDFMDYFGIGGPSDLPPLPSEE